MNLLRSKKPQGLAQHKTLQKRNLARVHVGDNSSIMSVETVGSSPSSKQTHALPTSVRPLKLPRSLIRSTGPVDVDEVGDKEKILLVEIEQFLRHQHNHEIRKLSTESCSSDSSCTLTSSTTLSSDTSSTENNRRVLFSDDVQYIEPDQLSKKVDRKMLWWGRKDRDLALAEMRNEARVLASDPEYRQACITVLLHCKALSLTFEEECLGEDHGVLASARSKKTPTPPEVAEAVQILVDPNVRGLERACLQRLKLRAPGRPCYFWRCNPVRATASVIQLQERLGSLADRTLSDLEKGCLLSVQYQPYGFYASTWAQLLAEGDAAASNNPYRRVYL